MNRTMLLVTTGFVLAFSACQSAVNNPANNTKTAATHGASKMAVLTEIKTSTGRPDIQIDGYTLVAADPETVKAEAEAVMEVKKKYPLAMRTKDRALFDEILARDFTFKSPRNFFNREDYINDRTAGETSDWSVKYNDMTVGFSGEIAIVTYSNVVKAVDNTGKPTFTEYMIWVDQMIKESGKWKIQNVRLLDYREELH